MGVSSSASSKMNSIFLLTLKKILTRNNVFSLYNRSCDDSQFVKSLKLPATASLTIYDNSLNNVTFNRTFHIAIKIFSCICICQPMSGAFSDYKHSLLLVYYFSISLYLMFSIWIKSVVTELRKSPTICSLKKSQKFLCWP